MNMKQGAFVAVGLLASSAPLQAASVDLNQVPYLPYITSEFNYQFADHARQSDNGLGVSLGGGVPLNKWFNVELTGLYTRFNSDSTPPAFRWNDYGGHLNGMFFYNRHPHFAPFFELGAGAVHSVAQENHISNDGVSPMVDTGLGFFSYWKLFGHAVGVRADATYRWTFDNADDFKSVGVGNPLHEPILSVGLVIPLGRTHEHTKLDVPPKPPVDDDHKDHPDAGVNHKFEDIHFAFDKYDLSAYSRALLDQDTTEIDKLTKKAPDLKVDVSGHTDWIGTDAYNQALSERRAKVVKDYLIGKGVAEKRIRTYAYGESQPIAPNTTAEGRALNRRAEIRTTDSP